MLGIVLIVLLIVVILMIVFRKNNINSIQETKVLCEVPSSSYFKFNDLECHYTDEGSGDPVVLIHGLGDSFKIYDDFAILLAKNYRVLRIDLPAFGLSELPTGDLKMEDLGVYYRNFLSCFVEELELDSFHLFGNSLGGWVAWDWTSHNNEKVKSLCLLASAGFEMDKVKKNITKGVLELIPDKMLQKGMPFAVAKLNAKETIYDSQKITKQHILINYRMINKKGTLNFMFKLLVGSFVPEISDVSEVKVPTLIVWGAKDKIIPVRHADWFNAAIANSQKIIYPNCGHYPQIEYPEMLLKDWKGFTANLG